MAILQQLGAGADLACVACCLVDGDGYLVPVGTGFTARPL